MQSSELQLSELQLATSECTLATLQNVRLNWWPRRREVENSLLDHACFDYLPVSEETKTPPKLTALFDAKIKSPCKLPKHTLIFRKINAKKR